MIFAWEVGGGKERRGAVPGDTSVGLEEESWCEENEGPCRMKHFIWSRRWCGGGEEEASL